VVLEKPRKRMKLFFYILWPLCLNNTLVVHFLSDGAALAGLLFKVNSASLGLECARVFLGTATSGLVNRLFPVVWSTAS